MGLSKLRKWIFLLVILCILAPLGNGISQQPEFQVYLPLALAHYIDKPELELSEVWVGNAHGLPVKTYLPGAPLRYIAEAQNHTDAPITAELRWDQTGPCGSTQIFTQTLDIDPGIWVQVHPEGAPACLGTYTNTVQFSSKSYTSTLTTNFRINTASVVLSDQQGFDRCNLPSIAEMQTWWDSSPYWVVNIYLGGISYDNTSGCSNENIDANWIQSVAQQGWSFLLAWVGPQAPCSGYTYKMSQDALASFQEGRAEADAALIAAADIGLANSIIIYYDVEGYGNEDDLACRQAVSSFLQGWTNRLHELGAKAGAYGSPCNSHIRDWAANAPPLDDVWIAHWSDTDYNPFATVWDAPCLANALWANHQRVKQYAGDHYEEWGGLLLRVDSNILDGEVVSLAITESLTTTHTTSPLQLSFEPQIREMDLLSESHGWVLRDNRLLSTSDGGASWQDHTPAGIANILDVHFLDISRGWLLHQDDLGLRLLQTLDGGTTWNLLPLPPIGDNFASASVNFTDTHSGKLIVQLSYSRVFNRVREFTTRDGGQNWTGGKPHSLPIETEDPSTNTPMNHANRPPNLIAIDWANPQIAWALTQRGICQGDKFPLWIAPPPNAQSWQCQQHTQLWSTIDGGLTWVEITP